jgi:hypothetical protein
MSNQWFPIGSSPEAFEALVPGIPPWARRDVADWLKSMLVFVERGVRQVNLDVVKGFDQRVRRADPLSHRLEDYGFENLERYLFDDSESYIAFLDYLVWRLAGGDTDFGRSKLADLDVLLTRCGSEWTVGSREGVPGLEKRVPEGVLIAAMAAMTSPGHAGSLLSEAWHATFGVSPDFEKGYAKSIKAVEAAAVPVVRANNSGATLGTVVGQIRDQGDWRLELSREHSTHSTQQVILGMLQSLWTGQNDRHAGQPGYTPSTQAEAEAAVMLAVPIVQWFSSGAIKRR